MTAAGSPNPAAVASGPASCSPSRREFAEGQAPGWADRAAVLVLFDRVMDIGRTLEQLRRIARHIVLVDNSPDAELLSIQSCPQLMWHASVMLVRNGNIGGLAGAYNAALARLAQINPAVRQVVFADDDSDCNALHAFLCDASTQAALERTSTAAVAPAYRERATGMRGAYIELGRWRFAHLPREMSGTHSVAFLINSMSVWRREAIELIGDFDEQLGVDHIDTEYCLRARSLGLKLFVNGDHEFNHSIGERRSYRFLGFTLQSGGHGAARRRSIAENTAALMRRYVRREPAFAMLCASRLLYEVLGVVMVEEHKGSKLRAIVHGAMAGFRTFRSKDGASRASRAP